MNTSTLKPHLVALCALVLFTCSVGCGASGGDTSRTGTSPNPSESKLWVPDNDGWMTDLAGLFDEETAHRLTATIASYERITAHEFAVLVVEDLRGEAIEDFSLRVFRTWGIGKPDWSNGLLITLAMKEQRIRIEVGLGLESAISNEFAGEIIDNAMTPQFREGRYADGLEEALVRLMLAARDTTKGE